MCAKPTVLTAKFIQNRSNICQTEMSPRSPSIQARMRLLLFRCPNGHWMDSFCEPMVRNTNYKIPAFFRSQKLKISPDHPFPFLERLKPAPFPLCLYCYQAEGSNLTWNWSFGNSFAQVFWVKCLQCWTVFILTSSTLSLLLSGRGK